MNRRNKAMRTAAERILRNIKINVGYTSKICCLATGLICCLLVISKPAEAQYNGTYHGRRVIAKSLADWCQVADDTIVSDVSALRECTKKLAAKIQDDEAKVQEQGKKEYHQILFDQWLYAAAQGKNKNANAANYLDEYATLMEAVNSPGGDAHSDEVGIAAATEKQMIAMLDLMSMYNEQLKALALSDIPQIEPELTNVLPANGDTQNVEFTGMYEDIQVVPNSLAVYCQLNGSDFINAEQQEKVKKCLDVLITKINTSNDAERQENVDDYSVINTEQAQNMLIKAVERSAGDVDFAKARQDQDEANSESLTGFETTASISAASNLQLTAMNDFLHLYATKAKYQALKNIKNVDAKAIANELKEAQSGPAIDDMEVSASSDRVSVTVTQNGEEEIILDEEGTEASSVPMYDADSSSDGNEPPLESLLNNSAEMVGTIKR